jgi:hypothetical protein
MELAHLVSVKKTCDGESIMAMMGSTSEKMYLCLVPNFGF